MQTPVQNRSYFVSDLHLFSRRTVAARFEPQIHEAAHSASCFVLGGDIFDFRWTTLESMETTAAAACQWLAQLVSANPACSFHFVLGNHDCHYAFVPQLEALAKSLPNLKFHPYYVRLGDNLFLHGDVADRRMDQDMLARRRSRWASHPKRGPLANTLYDWVVNAGIHRVAASLKHRHRKVARRLLRYANEIGHGPKTGLKQIYFGHTHVALDAFEYRGILFHNGGAPIRGVPFTLLEIP